MEPAYNAKHGENIVELKNVSFSYGDEAILKDIDLEIHRGDYFGVIGPNGGGKTTLLRIILGLLPAQGEIKLFGKNIREFKEWWRVGYVSQKVTQIDPAFPMTVEGAVSMGCFGKRGLFRFPDSEDRKKVTQALKQVEMEEYRTRLIGDLSGGQQQRVFIARALAGEPEVIVLDEPTANIDAGAEEQFYQFLRKLNRDMHLTLILVSHDLDTIEREATELLCVNKTVRYCGLPHEFRTHKNFLDLYARDGKINPHQ